MAIEKIALKNIDKVVDGETAPLEASTHVDLVTAAAYQDSVAAAEHVEEVSKELEEKAEEITTEAPEAPKVKEDSVYTKKYVLDESIEDFSTSTQKTRVNDDADRYVNFDMFDFIYNLFSSETDALIRPKKALSNIKTKKDEPKPSFNYQGSDTYTSETGEEGINGTPQISTDMDGNILLYKDNESDFDIVKELCDEYELSYEGPVKRRAPWVRWAYSFKVIVPTYADGTPMAAEDYFEDIGISMEDVMATGFTSKRDNDLTKDTDNSIIDTVYDKWTKIAARNNDPLKKYIKGMFAELDELGVNYAPRKKELTDKFNDYFNDDFEDEE